MRIVKNASSVELRYDNNIAFKVLPTVAILDVSSDNKVYLRFSETQDVLVLDPKQIASTQVLPAAAVPFTGTATDLLTLLKASFFIQNTVPVTATIIGTVPVQVVDPVDANILNPVDVVVTNPVDTNVLNPVEVFTSNPLDVVGPITIEQLIANEIDNFDAGGSLPVSEKTTLGNYVQDKDNLPLLLSRVGTGTQTYGNGGVLMEVTAGQYAICQSFQRHPYFAGKSQREEVTFSGYGLQTGYIKEAGYYSSGIVAPYNTTFDGLYFESNGDLGTYNFCVSNSNVPDTKRFAQADWNVDKLDGSGKSGITLNPNNFTVFIMDFLYLGGTAVRFGFKFGTKKVWAHVYVHSNTFAGTFLSSPHQPIRWSIRASVGALGTGTCTQICAAVHTEGSLDIIGTPRSTPINANFVNANTIGTIYLLTALRLANTANGRKTNILNLDFSAMAGSVDDLVIMLILNPQTINGAPVWLPVASGSNVEYLPPDVAGNPSATTISVGTGTILYQDFISQAQRVNMARELSLVRRVGYAIDGTRDVMALAVMPTATGNNADVYGLFNFQEY